MKILSINDLNNLRKRAQQALALREESSDQSSEQCCGLATGAEHLQVLCCGGTGCKASNSHKIVDNLKAALEENGIADKVDVITTGCFGFCEKGPIVKIIPDNTFYTQVKPEDATEIVKEHIIGGRRVERLLYVDPKTPASGRDDRKNRERRLECGAGVRTAVSHSPREAAIKRVSASARFCVSASARFPVVFCPGLCYN